MATKLSAARIAMEGGCDMVITNGAYPERLYDILEGQEVSAILLTRLNLAQALYPNLELELERNSFSNLRNGLKNGHYDLIVTLDFDVEEEKEFYSVPVCPQPPIGIIPWPKSRSWR